MDIKERISKFLSLSLVAAGVAIGEAKAESLNPTLEKKVSKYLYSEGDGRELLKSIEERLRERLDGERRWIENSQKIKQIIGEIPDIPLKFMQVEEGGQVHNYYFAKFKGMEGVLVAKEGFENGYFVPFGRGEVYDLKGDRIDKAFADMVYLGRLGEVSAEKIQEINSVAQEIVENINQDRRHKLAEISTDAVSVVRKYDRENPFVVEYEKQFDVSAFMLTKRDRLPFEDRDEFLKKNGGIKQISIDEFPEKVKGKDIEKVAQQIMEKLNRLTGLNVSLEFEKVNDVRDENASAYVDENRIKLFYKKDGEMTREEIAATLAHEVGHMIHAKEVKAIELASSNTEISRMMRKNAERMADWFAVKAVGQDVFVKGMTDSFKKMFGETEADWKEALDEKVYPSVDERITAKKLKL